MSNSSKLARKSSNVKINIMENLAEIYFVSAMMILILIGCAIAVVLFFRTYKREQLEREKEARKIEQLKRKEEKEEQA